MTDENKLYVACSLTQAPQDFKEQVEQLKTELRKKNEVFEFFGLVSGTEQDVYHWDIEQCVGNCDFLVAICDYPSLGLGYEIAAAVEKFHTPVLSLGHTNTRISRLIVGVDAPGYSFVRYQSLTEVPSLVEAGIARIGHNQVH